MKKFIIIYWLNLALLFSILYWDISPIADIVNYLQTDFTTYLVSLTLDESLTKGYEIVINKHYSLVIEKSCNGIVPYLLFLASIIAFPSTLKHKIKYALIGYTFITVINIFRIWIVTKLVLAEVENFSLAHDVIGNTILILTALVLFIFFVKTKRRKNDTNKIRS